MFDTFSNNKQAVESSVSDTLTTETELPDWKKEYNRQVQTEPASKIASEYGDFYHASFPKQFPKSEVANRDLGEEITKETKQVILNGYFYEK